MNLFKPFQSAFYRGVRGGAFGKPQGVRPSEAKDTVNEVRYVGEVS